MSNFRIECLGENSVSVSETSKELFDIFVNDPDVSDDIDLHRVKIAGCVLTLYNIADDILCIETVTPWDAADVVHNIDELYKHWYSEEHPQRTEVLELQNLNVVIEQVADYM